MSDTTTTTETTTVETNEPEGKTFNQADVDKIVRDRLAQQAKNKYGDYDELKAKAEGAKTVEDKLADLEQKHADAEARALRSNIAAQYGISTKKGPDGEPSDADLFLTGSDEGTLIAQAERLGERQADVKKKGNVARREGGRPTTNENPKDAAKREWLRSLSSGD